MRWTKLDGGITGFDRATGTNLLYASDATAAFRREAPRSLQIGLLTPCNLTCSFCYRDQSAPNRLDAPFLVDLLQRAARWGVLEVAFGGGEPLLFKGGANIGRADGFAKLVETLHATTPLGINVTTNGTLVTRALLDRLRGKLGEYRLSIYPDNDWQRTLAVFRDARIAPGVNWLVTPASVREVVARVRDFVERGAKNVLLLGYKGADASLHLGAADRELLRRALDELVPTTNVLLDICWHPYFADLPHLFPRTDCGAGDDILVITPDRAVQACSFADHRVPFETFDDLVAVYRMMRAARPHANVEGCTRELFAITPKRTASGRVLPVDDQPVLYAWHGRASSNSGAYTILASFVSEDAARIFERELDDMYQAHLDFMVEDSERAMDHYRVPTPPMVALAQRYGFTWPAENGFAWEGDSFGDREEADRLEIERFGANVIVYLSYGQEIGDGGLEQLAARLGGMSFNHTGSFRVVVTPLTPEAEDKVQRALDNAEVEYLANRSYAGDPEAVAAAEASDAADALGPAEWAQPWEDCEYRIEVATEKLTHRLGYASTIGGLGESSRLVIDLARIKQVRFELHGGRPPRMTIGPLEVGTDVTDE